MSMIILEYSAVFFSLLAVIVAAKLSRHTFTFGGLGAVLYCLFFYFEELYFSSVLQIYYIGMSIWGYFHWKEKDKVKEMVKNPFSPKVHVLVVILTVLGGYWISNIFPSSKLGLTDATLMIGSVINTYLLVKADKNTWAYWCIIDCVYIWQYATSGLIATTSLYCLYLLVSVRNYIVWGRA